MSLPTAAMEQRLRFILRMPLWWVPCNLCGSAKFSSIYREHSNFGRCAECGLVFYNPQPSPESLAEYYNQENGYLPCLRAQVQEAYHTHREAFLAAYDDALARIGQYRAPYPAPPASGSSPPLSPPPDTPDRPVLLEVGCGYGYFLARAKEHGWHVAGIELGAESSRFARESLGLPVETSTVFESALPDSTVDCVVMMQVIEHVSDPLETLVRVRRFLKPGGLLYLTTPNIESLASRLQGDHWELKSFPNHLWYFSAATLGRLLRRAGLVPCVISSHCGESSLGLDEKLIRQQLFLPPEEKVEELLALAGRHLRCSELWTIAASEVLPSAPGDARAADGGTPCA